MSESIVVGYIPTPEGIAAFERAKDEALFRGTRLVVVNTGHHGDFASPIFATPEDIDAITAELTRTGLSFDVVQPTGGLAAADEILRVAETEDASLIVIGMRHRTPVGKLLLGSTSQQVLLDASCAVLAVKAPAA
ncbi:universal stress protein [Pedococcus sp. 5OH_020]|uniref:universal stress protein n=1 Tax=Pedococcus sp. 5OH_020 TaxID=2989814 RepID=UPI0022E9A069|nr:universal stress protein [Pedococcus sp. 5OH_020]